MELYQLRTFVTVARERNLSRAAERLFTSQPAVSAQIKALESELQIHLFTRSPRGMELTARGERLLAEAEKALAAVRGMLGEAMQLREELDGTFRLGTISDPVAFRIGEFLSRMSAEHPRLHIELKQGITGTVIEDLLAGELDTAYAIGPIQTAGVAALRLAPVRLLVAAPFTWRERVQGQPWEAIAQLPWIGTPPLCSFNQLTHALFQKHGSVFRPIQIAADQEQTLLGLVASGAGLSLLREEQAREAEEREAVTIWPGDTVHTALSFLCLAEAKESPAVKAALRVVKSVWSEIVNPDGVTEA